MNIIPNLIKSHVPIALPQKDQEKGKLSKFKLFLYIWQLAPKVALFLMRMTYLDHLIQTPTI